MKHGRCTNTDCEQFSVEVEVEDWWPFVCKSCKKNLSSIKKIPFNYLLPGILLLFLFVGGFGAYNLLYKDSSNPESPPVPDTERQEEVAIGPADFEASNIPADPFAELESYLLVVASASSSDDVADRHVDKILAMCASPHIEVRFVSNQGTVTERSTISDFLDRLRVLQEDDFKVSKVFRTSSGDKIATIEIQETRIG